MIDVRIIGHPEDARDEFQHMAFHPAPGMAGLAAGFAPDRN